MRATVLGLLATPWSSFRCSSWPRQHISICIARNMLAIHRNVKPSVVEHGLGWTTSCCRFQSLSPCVLHGVEAPPHCTSNFSHTTRFLRRRHNRVQKPGTCFPCLPHSPPSNLNFVPPHSPRPRPWHSHTPFSPEKATTPAARSSMAPRFILWTEAQLKFECDFEALIERQFGRDYCQRRSQPEILPVVTSRDTFRRRLAVTKHNRRRIHFAGLRSLKGRLAWGRENSKSVAVEVRLPCRCVFKTGM